MTPEQIREIEMHLKEIESKTHLLTIETEVTRYVAKEIELIRSVLAPEKHLELMRNTFKTMGVPTAEASYKDSRNVVWTYLYVVGTDNDLALSVKAAEGNGKEIDRINRSNRFYEFEDGWIASC